MKLKLSITSRKSNGSACALVVQFNDDRKGGLKKLMNTGEGFENTLDKVIIFK